MPSVFGTVGLGTIVIREGGVVKHGGAAEIDFVGATVTKSGQRAVVTITSSVALEQTIHSIVTHQHQGNVLLDPLLAMDYAAVVIDESGNVVFGEI
jgi:hypothetical protein